MKSRRYLSCSAENAFYVANSAKKKIVKSKQVISALDSAKSLRLSRSLNFGFLFNLSRRQTGDAPVLLHSENSQSLLYSPGLCTVSPAWGLSLCNGESSCISRFDGKFLSAGEKSSFLFPPSLSRQFDHEVTSQFSPVSIYETSGVLQWKSLGN